MSQTIRPTPPEVKGYGPPFLLESGRKKEEKWPCGVYWAAVEATCCVDVLAGCLNTNIVGRAAILHILWVNTSPSTEGLRGKEEMRRMRVGCHLKTKDGVIRYLDKHSGLHKALCVSGEIC